MLASVDLAPRPRGPWLRRPIAQDAMQRVGGFARLSELLRQLGLDPARALAEAGLATDALGDAEARVSYPALCRLLHGAAEAADCPHVGLLAGRLWHLDDYGAIGDAMRGAPTVGAALRAHVVHQHQYSEAALSFLLARGPVAEFGYAHYRTRGPGIDLVHDAALAFGVNIMQELAGPDWRASEVLVAHARPADAGPWRQTFRVTPSFDSEYSALRFPARWLDRPRPVGDPVRARVAGERMRATGQDDIVQRVARGLRRLLLVGQFGGDDVAAHLAMHRRTLNRRLEDAGTTFREVLDDVRASVALELLEDSDLALDDVAASLGYAGVSPFMRAFRRWTGATPGQWRKDAHPGPRKAARATGTA